MTGPTFYQRPGDLQGGLSDALESLADKQTEAARLQVSLARSLALETLWPGIWAAGVSVRAQWSRRGAEMRFSITGPNGETRRFSRPAVPPVLRNPAAECEAAAWVQKYQPQRLADFTAGRI